MSLGILHRGRDLVGRHSALLLLAVTLSGLAGGAVAALAGAGPTADARTPGSGNRADQPASNPGP